MCAGVKREEDLKIREKTLQNLRIKGAFSAQELYDGHRGEYLILFFIITRDYVTALLSSKTLNFYASFCLLECFPFHIYTCSVECLHLYKLIIPLSMCCILELHSYALLSKLPKHITDMERIVSNYTHPASPEVVNSTPEASPANSMAIAGFSVIVFRLQDNIRAYG